MMIRSTENATEKSEGQSGPLGIESVVKPDQILDGGVLHVPFPVVSHTLTLGETSVPRVIQRDRRIGSFFVVELLRGDVDSNPYRLKPRMGLRAAIAARILRWVMPTLAKMIVNEIDTIPTGPAREFAKSYWSYFRVGLFYPNQEVFRQSTEGGELKLKIEQNDRLRMCMVSLGQDGSIGVNSTYPRSLCAFNRSDWDPNQPEVAK